MIRLASTIALLAAPALAEDRALVIGINDYSALETSQALNGAVADANRFATFLETNWGFAPSQITTLTNAPSEAILSTLIDSLVGSTAPGDRAVLYFAGLGTTLPDGTPALIAKDANTLLGQIPMDVITDMLAPMPDREITVVLDASFDGDAARLGSSLTRGAPGALDQADFSIDGTLWRGAKTGQFAWEDVDRGVFTDAFISGLQSGAADTDVDGGITNAELYDHVAVTLSGWCDTNAVCAATGRGLTPMFAGPADAVVGEDIRRDDPERIAPPTDALIADDGAPATYRETLGFVTDLFVPSNDAGLQLSMSGEPHIGGTVQFAVTADRPGALLLLDVDPNGALAQVFPSALAPTGSTEIIPQEPLIIPNGTGANGQPLRLRVSEPAGQGFLLALFVEGDLPTLTALMPDALSGGPIPNAGQYLYEISQDLLALQADSNTAVSWSATYLPYRIQP